ncbi:hypothetical protein VVD49_20875 [Uliginosibacterium sp. H3]|uniref:Uncharacterized protein n=1 Tax=Uliginosibacterium silvisoli TaxID=3114758 RepID=A0ABU6K934_9RHOO|nr:hypothetical protein [Uliginosibacterium sp. H3]
MRWRKLGVVYNPDGSLPWMHSHAAIPTPLDLGDGRLRIFVSPRDAKGMSRVGFVDVDATDPTRVLRVADQPCLDIGRPGTFDDNGAVCTSVVRLADGRLLMYYVGFELCTHIRYRLLTGAAISNDNGEHFEKVAATPILERSPQELYFRCGPFVMRDTTQERELFRMWYVAGSDWTNVGGKDVPVYEMRYMESPDGLLWPLEGETVMRLGNDEHGFGRPWIMRAEDGFKLHYSIRKISVGYRMGYAESGDGRDWTRMDEQLGLDVSPAGWDSEEIMYSAVVETGGRQYAFYNGNDFGGTGFGVARLESA